MLFPEPGASGEQDQNGEDLQSACQHAQDHDQLGKITPLIATDYDIHVMDVVMLPPRNNSTDNDQIKWALLKYGALAVNYNNSYNPFYFIF